MGLFPELNEDLEQQLNAIDNIVNTSSGIPKPTKSFKFDFNSGDFIIKDGKVQIAEGIEALKIWIIKVLKTEKFKFKIYESNKADAYGITLLDLIHSDYPLYFIQAEIQREITEALVRNEEILSVENFNFNREKRTLVVSFTVNSIYGLMAQEVKYE